MSYRCLYFKFNLILLIFFVTGLLFSPILQAQNFATVDTRILLILHPSMICYDYKNCAFFRDENPNKVSTKAFKELKRAQEKADQENEEILKKIKELDSKRFEYSKELLREQQVFAPGDLEAMKRKKADLEVVLKEYKKQKAENADQIKLQNSKIQATEDSINEINQVLNNPASLIPNEVNIKHYEEQIKNIDTKKAELNAKIMENNDKAMSAIYLTQKETEAKLIKIRNEIKQIIKEVAEKENCSLVIDDTFAMRDPEREKRKVIVSGIEEDQDVISSSLFHSFTNYQPDMELAKNLDMPEGESAEQHLVIGRTIGLEQNLKQYLEYRDYIPARVADFSFGTLFVSGGKNITALCAKRLFEKYKIPEYTRQRFYPVIEKYITSNNKNGENL